MELDPKGAPALPVDVHKRLADFIEGGNLELPVMPASATQIMAMTSDPNCDTKKLAEMISRDQSMAGNLLRIANSPLYMGAMKIVTLQQAITRLGLQVIRTTAVVISCETRAFAVKGWEADVKHMFQHSLCTALFAQEIAKSHKWNHEEAFLCGLLHDVGKPVLLQALVDIHREAGHPIDKAAVLGALDEFHARVGSYIVGDWKLPPRIAETIMYHHKPTEAPTASKAALLTDFAHEFAHHTLLTQPVLEEKLVTHPHIAALGISDAELQALLGRRQKMREAVTGMAG